MDLISVITLGMYFYVFYLILDSGRRDEYIDFTMMCVFHFFHFIFVSVATIWGSKTALIFFNSILFDGKVNLVGAFGRLKFKISKSFQKCREKQHTN